jgi:predicted ATPase
LAKAALNCCMRLKTLGGLALEPSDLSRPKPLLLLAYLAVEGAKEKRHLYELFWPEAADPANSLRVVSKLIREVGPELLLADERTLSTQLESDIAALQTALTNQDAETIRGLYQGGFLAEFSLPDWGNELEEWVYSTREFVTSRVRAAWIRAAETEAAKGAFVAAARWAEQAYQLTREAPEPEDLERLYPLLLAGDSIHSAEAKRRAKEYGLELNLSPDEARGRYFKAVPEGSPELPTVANNLPRGKTSFIGRDPELVELGQMIGQGEARMITLLGPGGIGKTRLALQLASGQLHETNFGDGVYFVPLEALSEPAQIPLALAQTLGIKVKDDPLEAVRAGIGNKRLLLVLDNFEHLVDGALMVSELLEACPHLSVVVTSRERLNLEEEFVLALEGLPLPDTDHLELALLEYNDAVKLFVQRAKRARLEFALSSETLPHVLSICRFVAGSPLGIELAAVWLRSLPIADLARDIGTVLEELESPSRNVLERHQSLRAVFEYSWKLLRPKEQATLARLSVFVGGFIREAASVVAEATIPLLTSLVDKSLLRLDPEGRYDFHPLLYQYASEKLEPKSEAASLTRAKHGQCILGLIETGRKAGTQAHIRCCIDEHQNALAALAWSQESHEPMLGLRLANVLASFWEVQGYVSEGRHWITTVLSHSGATTPTEERARALLNAGRIFSRLSDRALAVTYGNQALALAEALGLEAVSIRALVLLANEANSQGDIEGGKKHAEAGLALARKLGDDELVAVTLVVLGSLAEGLGHLDESWTLFQESLTLLRKLGRHDTADYALNLSNLGYITWLRGDLRTAKSQLEEALAVAGDLHNLFLVFLVKDNLSVVMLDLGDLTSAQVLTYQVLEYRHAQHDRWGMTFSLENFASLAVEHNDARRAACLWGVSERLREEIHAPMIASWQARQERFAARANTQIDEAGFRAAWQEGRLMGLEEAVKYALEIASVAPIPISKT